MATPTFELRLSCGVQRTSRGHGNRYAVGNRPSDVQMA